MTEINFDREDMRSETALWIREQFIKISEKFLFEGKFPWFPHTYAGKSGETEANAFFKILRAHEDDYLALPWQEQRNFLKRPLNIDFLELVRRMLGVGF